MRKVSLDYGRCDCSANRDRIEDHVCFKERVSRNCRDQSLGGIVEDAQSGDT